MEEQVVRAAEPNSVNQWFGDAFFDLHPRLQQLHRQGGLLKGRVVLHFGDGLAGFIGKRIAAKLGVPLQAGEHELQVAVHHENGMLYWSRCFDEQHIMQSIFIPFGNYLDGYWLEKTGPISVKLTVDIIEGAWCWRVMAIRLFGLPLPMFLFPGSTAYKKVIGDCYQFHVGFSLSWIGRLFCYEGNLAFQTPQNHGRRIETASMINP
ncbi:MAG: DUF4166 domain-containing protein [Arenimonas sp.]